MKHLMLIAITAATAALSACGGGGSISCTGTIPLSVPGDPQTEAAGNPSRDINISGAVVSNSDLTGIDANDILVDVTGTTTTLPQSGFLTLTVTNGSTVLGAHSFAWSKHQNSLQFASPSAVNQWLATLTQGATAPTVSYQFDTISVTGAADTDVTVSTRLMVNGSQQAASSATWHQPCSKMPHVTCMPL
jgi:hypothetical protein